MNRAARARTTNVRTRWGSWWREWGTTGSGAFWRTRRGRRYAPDGWARKALELFGRWKADRIVAEKNFGGAMVEATIRTASRTVPVKLLNASRGKVQGPGGAAV